MPRLVWMLLTAAIVSACTGSTDDSSATSTRTGAPMPGPSIVRDDRLLYQPGGDVWGILFAVPSGNILCDIGSESDADFLTCFVKEHSWSDPECPPGAGAMFTIGQTDDLSAELSCGPFPSDRKPYRVLPYGHSVKGIQIACTSEQRGVTCADERAPFGRVFISKASYKLN